MASPLDANAFSLASHDLVVPFSQPMLSCQTPGPLLPAVRAPLAHTLAHNVCLQVRVRARMYTHIATWHSLPSAGALPAPAGPVFSAQHHLACRGSRSASIYLDGRVDNAATGVVCNSW